MKTITKGGMWMLGLSMSLAAAGPARAHFAWIEAEATAAPASGQTMHVYFGEYSEFLREERGGRLDTMDGIRLRVTHPKQGPSEVALSKDINRFSGNMSACAPGRHEVVAEQRDAPVQDLRSHDLGVVKPMYYARTSFICLEEGRVSEQERQAPVPLDLDIIPLSRGVNLATGQVAHAPGGEIVVRAMFKGQALPSVQVIVHAPIGWDKELHTGSDGVTTFTPMWPGRYVLELLHVEKSGGEFQGKPYEVVRHRSTLAVQVRTDRAERP
ncbi:MAG: DUF4198 domain-containing protein [Nitrospiraceae bacterium]|nr:DUF4198 domain-containing protein [Nitrospiraceae bacterium]